MALTVKYLAVFSSGSLRRHISPECFLHVPTALAPVGRRRLEASGGRDSPRPAPHQLWSTAAFTENSPWASWRPRALMSDVS